MIKALLFDLDGVLIDSETYYVKKDLKWMKDLGYNLKEEDIYFTIGASYTEQLKMFRGLVNNSITIEETDRLVQEYIKKYPMNIEELIIPDAVDLMKYAKAKGLKVAVCSSSSPKEIKNVLDAAKITDLPDIILSGHDFTNSKPDPEIYLHAVEKLKVKKDECIILEDSYYGILAGVRAGIYTVARRDTRFGTDQTTANIVIDNFNSVKRLLEVK